MKKKLLVAALLAVAGTSAIAQVQANKETGFYAELGLAQAYYTEPSVNFNHSMGVGKVGYNLNKNTAFEIMAAGNLNSVNFYYGSTFIANVKIDSAYGAYGKFSLPVNDDVSLFVRVGATNASISASTRYGRYFTSGSSLSYGAGAQFNFTKAIYGQVDYMSYYNRNDISVTAPSISVGYKF
jgi:outer membrane immunogenic protein